MQPNKQIKILNGVVSEKGISERSQKIQSWGQNRGGPKAEHDWRKAQKKLETELEKDPTDCQTAVSNALSVCPVPEEPRQGWLGFFQGQGWLDGLSYHFSVIWKRRSVHAEAMECKDLVCRFQLCY